MNRAAFLAGSNFCTVSGLLTAAGAETVYDTTVAIDYCIDGIAYAKATVADGVTPTADQKGDTLIPLQVSEGCALLWMLNAAGTVAVMQGGIEDLDSADAFKKAPEFPEVPEDNTAFAYMILTNGAAGSEFVIGTDNWNQTGAVVSIKNLMVLPSRPQVA